MRAGLAIVAAVARRHGAGAPLACRVGVATGLVVVGDRIGEGAAREETVIGDAPNLAARVQELAAPGKVVVAEATRRLLGDVFALKSLPPPDRPLRGERRTGERVHARDRRQDGGRH